MKRQHFVVESKLFANVAETHLDRVEEARDAREQFAIEHRAEGFRVFQSLEVVDGKPFVMAVTGLQFAGALPKGFARSDRHPDFAVPDISTEKGKEIAAQMAALPPVPLPVALAAAIGYGSPLKVQPEGGAVTLGVEPLAGELVLSVPVFSAAETEARPELAWAAPAGLKPISDVDYREMRRYSQEHDQRPSMGARL
jgi:hypothetical protein